MNTYKLSQIVSIVEKWFKQLFGDFDFWVEAEISMLKEIKNRIYLDLVEFDNSGQISAKARAIIFEASVLKSFQKEVGIESLDQLKGNKILVLCKLNFHVEYGFSLIVNDISKEYTLWQFQTNLQNIRKELKSLGIFENNKNLPLPFPPFHIAIISSQNSQWLEDFLTILNNSQYKFEYSLYETPIHWNDAKESVYQSLKKIYIDEKDWKKIDLVAIVRWWGWSSWIIWQNDINIAKAICNLWIPLILAIWHTSDKYILDEIVRISAKTPSDAAYTIINILEWYSIELKDKISWINQDVQRKINSYRTQLITIKQFLSTHFVYQINKLRQNLDNMRQFIESISPHRLTKKWYWVLKDLNWVYLSNELISNLKSNDVFIIDIYGQEIVVQVVENKQKQSD